MAGRLPASQLAGAPSAGVPGAFGYDQRRLRPATHEALVHDDSHNDGYGKANDNYNDVYRGENESNGGVTPSWFFQISFEVTEVKSSNLGAKRRVKSKLTSWKMNNT